MGQEVPKMFDAECEKKRRKTSYAQGTVPLSASLFILLKNLQLHSNYYKSIVTKEFGF